MLVGVGFSCQAAFEGTHYRRLPASRDPRFAWMFDGIEEDVLGDYGLSGGGAAGFELDRADPMLGTPDGTVILARSEDPLPSFLTVPEELLSNTITHQRRDGRGPGARRDRVFRHAVRRRGVLGRLDHLLRQPVAQRLRRSGVATAGERGAPLGRVAAMTPPLHLNLFIHGRGHHEAAWRHPAASPLALTDIRYYTDLARKAEAGLFDSVFLADTLAVGEDVARAPRTWLEPITVLAALAGATSRIGLIATCSTTYTEPFNLARQFASLDHISSGRVGWNIVTTWLAAASGNFGARVR